MISHAPKKLAKLPRHRDQPMSLKVVGAYSFLRTTRRYQPFILLGFDNSHPTIFRHWDSQVFPSRDVFSSGITSLYRSRAFSEQFGSAKKVWWNTIRHRTHLSIYKASWESFHEILIWQENHLHFFQPQKRKKKNETRYIQQLEIKDTSDSTQLSVGFFLKQKNAAGFAYLWHLESPWNKPPVAFASARCGRPLYPQIPRWKKKTTNGYPPKKKFNMPSQKERLSLPTIHFSGVNSLLNFREWDLVGLWGMREWSKNHRNHDSYLMDKIPNNHLGWCWNPINNGIIIMIGG